MVGEDNVEARVGERHALGRRVDQRELEACGRECQARVLELALGVVDADRASPLRGEEDRPLRSAAAELQHVHSGHIAEDSELALGKLPETPTRLRAPDVLAMRLLVGVGLAIPERAVALKVRQALRL